MAWESCRSGWGFDGQPDQLKVVAPGLRSEEATHVCFFVCLLHELQRRSSPTCLLATGQVSSSELLTSYQQDVYRLEGPRHLDANELPMCRPIYLLELKETKGGGR